MYVYYGLSEEEIKFQEIIYKQNKNYYIKGINLSLKGLKRFLLDNKMQNIINNYTKVKLDNFEIVEEVIKNNNYDMIGVKIPFKFKIDKIYKINWRKK